MFHIKWPWKRKEYQWARWFELQWESLERGEEIAPPWIAFPGEDPWWGGWRQGNGEGWLHIIWLPFWNSITDEARVNYIEKWNAPDEWREYLGQGAASNESSDESSSVAGHVLNLSLFRTGK